MEFEKIMEAFGCYTQRVNGADISAIDRAVENAINCNDAPSVIVLDTIKGQGITCIEKMENNHHITIDEELKAMIEKELECLEVAE